MLRSFPPSSLQQLAAQRDVLLAYAAESPAAVAAGFSAAYLLMQVGGGRARLYAEVPTTPPFRLTSARPAQAAAGVCQHPFMRPAAVSPSCRAALQTFAIPGTIFLSLLAGSLYGVWRGSALVAGGTMGQPTGRAGCVGPGCVGSSFLNLTPPSSSPHPTTGPLQWSAR